MSETSPPMRPMFPIFLKIEGRLCVVIGGGPIGAQKARELAECGAKLRVVSPELCEDWDAVRALALDFEHRARSFEKHDVDGAFVVISATADAMVDDKVHAAGKRAGAIVNVVDVPSRCDYYAASVVRRGPVTVAIGTSGVSPSLAIAIRRQIEAQVPANTEALAALLAERRDTWRSRFPNYRERALRLNRAVAALYGAACEGVGPERLARGLDRVSECERDCASQVRCCAAEALEEEHGA